MRDGPGLGLESIVCGPDCKVTSSDREGELRWILSARFCRGKTAGGCIEVKEDPTERTRSGRVDSLETIAASFLESTA